MSLIHTCRPCDIDPVAYLTELQGRPRELSRNPQEWMPRSYAHTLQRVDSAPAAPS